LFLSSLHDFFYPPALMQRTQHIAALRRIVARLESAFPDATTVPLPFGLPEIDRHFPGSGLTGGALHEVIATSHGDRPAAFGFAIALMVHALAAHRGPAVLIAARRCFADFGQPYGHGLRQLGLDVDRLVLVEARLDKDALWAMEEALRPEVAAAAVAGAVEGDLDLTMSRRLNLAAAGSGTPLILLRPPVTAGTSAAATRWRIAAAPAGRERFGTFAFRRWSVALERCRNGRPGHWLLEWNHVAHRFGLAELLADRAPAAGASQDSSRLAG
jgi:protein ImuA